MVTEADALEAFLAEVQKWPLWKAWHCLDVKATKEDSAVWVGYSTVWVGYSTVEKHRTSWETGFDVELADDNCYLLSINLSPLWRGKGHGWELYQVVERAAARLGCKRVVMTASGTTYRGETRMDYLLRRGYQRGLSNDGEVTKELIKETVHG